MHNFIRLLIIILKTKYFKNMSNGMMKILLSNPGPAQGILPVQNNFIYLKYFLVSSYLNSSNAYLLYRPSLQMQRQFFHQTLLVLFLMDN